MVSGLTRFMTKGFFGLVLSGGQDVGPSRPGTLNPLRVAAKLRSGCLWVPVKAPGSRGDPTPAKRRRFIVAYAREIRTPVRQAPSAAYASPAALTIATDLAHAR